MGGFDLDMTVEYPCFGELSLSLSFGNLFSFFRGQIPLHPEAATNQHQTMSFQELERS